MIIDVINEADRMEETHLCEAVSVSEMRDRDARTIDEGTPGHELMRRAALGIYRSYDKWSDGCVIFCGSGNNGGDGYALAEIIAGNGISVSVIAVQKAKTPDAMLYEEKAVSSGVNVIGYTQGLLEHLRPRQIVDCMLGTGFSGEPREPFGTAIREINEYREREKAVVISADINSGMNGDSGDGSIIIRSDITATIGLMKKGLLTEKARTYMDELVLIDIGII